MVMTSEFIPLLLKSSDPRLLFITSGTSPLAEHDKTDTPPLKAINGSPPAGRPKDEVMNPTAMYRSSKTGMNMVVSPGFLATGLAGIGAEQLKKIGAQDPSVGGEFISGTLSKARGTRMSGGAVRKDSIQPW